MTRFADPEIVRCPACEKLVERQSFCSIHLSSYLFPETFQNIARGNVKCPHCGSPVNAKELEPLVRLDKNWKRWIWAGLPAFIPESR